MPGFYLSNIITTPTLTNVFNERCIKESIEYPNYTIARNTLKKFLGDKVFFQDERYIIITEGVILNKLDLMKQYGKIDFFETIIELIEQKGESFFSCFRGSFSGAVYYKDSDRWVVYTNHIGSKPIFYYAHDGVFCLGSQPNYVLETLRGQNVSMTLCEKAAYFMMAYGFIADDSTYVNEIKRVEPGSFLVINKGMVQIKSYYSTEHNKIDLSSLNESEIIEELDKRFKEAIRLEYEKDREYGFRHLSDLSGGLDSRMNVWVSQEMGYKNRLCTTYCQSKYLDEKIAKKIASDLKMEIIVKSLDDASFIYDVDKVIDRQYGTAYYAGGTGMLRTLETINLDDFGIKHAGQLGDSILGTTIKSKKELDLSNDLFLTVKMFENKIDRKHLTLYSNREICRMNVLGFHGTLSTQLMVQNYTETESPFTNPDFMDFCFSIPIGMRIQHEIYAKWICKIYPQAAHYPWDHIRSRITPNRNVNRLRYLIKRSPQLAGKLLCKIGIPLKHNSPRWSMNPFDTWYIENKSIRNFLNSYNIENKNNPSISSILAKDMQDLFANGNMSEKLYVLTLMSAIKYYLPSHIVNSPKE